LCRFCGCDLSMPNIICGACDYNNPPGSKACTKCGVTFASYVPIPPTEPLAEMRSVDGRSETSSP
jgi:hypothetical protein